jgi:hypothetical protein
MNKLKAYCQKSPVNGSSLNSTQANIDLSNKSVPVTDWFNRLGDNAAPNLCRSVLDDNNNPP